MSGKRRLSSTGKWLLDSSGKAKICTCCGGGPTCPCPNACWRFTITATAPEGACEDCSLWAAGLEYMQEGPLYSCINLPCEEGDFGFPVSFCYVDGEVYIRASLEAVPPMAECDPFYIHYSLATPIPVDENGCPEDGTYTLTLDASHDGEPCDIASIEVQIEKVTCCYAACDCDGLCYEATITGGAGDACCVLDSVSQCTWNCAGTNTFIDGENAYLYISCSEGVVYMTAFVPSECCGGGYDYWGAVEMDSYCPAGTYVLEFMNGEDPGPCGCSGSVTVVIAEVSC